MVQRSVFMAIFGSILMSLSAVADVPSEQALRAFLQTQLKVSISNSCSVIERTGGDPSGPFEQTDYCNESAFYGLKTITGKVYRVVDGDTIHFYVKSKLYAIRMLGIDTPELHFKGTAQPRWGMIAKQSLLSMVGPGDTITLELDQTRCDRYGRVLGHVFKNGVNLNFEQVRRGYAANYCIAPNTLHCDAYSMAYRKAEQDRLGAHTDPCFVTPYVWRRGMSGEVMNKRLKDSRTDEIYSPGEYYRVPVAYRVFFTETN